MSTPHVNLNPNYQPAELPPQPRYRIEIGPIGVGVKDFLDRCHAEGWELVTMAVVPVDTAPRTTLNPHPVQVPGLMMVFRRLVGQGGQGGQKAPERPAVPILETLQSSVKSALPFIGLQGIAREKLEQAVEAADRFLTDPRD